MVAIASASYGLSPAAPGQTNPPRRVGQTGDSPTARAVTDPAVRPAAEDNDARAGAVAERERSKEEVEQAAGKINEAFGSAGRNLRFAIDQDTGKMVVKVTDSKTGQLIAQIPPEYALKIAQQLEKAQGLLFHQEA